MGGTVSRAASHEKEKDKGGNWLAALGLLSIYRCMAWHGMAVDGLGLGCDEESGRLGTGSCSCTAFCQHPFALLHCGVQGHAPTALRKLVMTRPCMFPVEWKQTGL